MIYNVYYIILYALYTEALNPKLVYMCIYIHIHCVQEGFEGVARLHIGFRAIAATGTRRS